MNVFEPIKINDPFDHQEIILHNPGQLRAYTIRKAYREGSSYSSNDLPKDVQIMLNQPIDIKQGDFQADPLDLLFLEEIMKKVETGAIKLFTPSTLLNQDVYEQLEPELKAKAEFDILILANKLREIKKLWDSGNRNTYQLFNLVHGLRLTKERLEQIAGDVFTI